MKTKETINKSLRFHPAPTLHDRSLPFLQLQAYTPMLVTTGNFLFAQVFHKPGFTKPYFVFAIKIDSSIAFKNLLLFLDFFGLFISLTRFSFCLKLKELVAALILMTTIDFPCIEILITFSLWKRICESSVCI